MSMSYEGIGLGLGSATQNVQRAIFGQKKQQHTCLEPQKPKSLISGNIAYISYMPTFKMTK
jgi:hypothetical protein